MREALDRIGVTIKGMTDGQQTASATLSVRGSPKVTRWRPLAKPFAKWYPIRREQK